MGGIAAAPRREKENRRDCCCAPEREGEWEGLLLRPRERKTMGGLPLRPRVRRRMGGVEPALASLPRYSLLPSPLPLPSLLLPPASTLSFFLFIHLAVGEVGYEGFHPV
eukprot:305863-Chlamydomonas_euryale.AAC.1